MLLDMKAVRFHVKAVEKREFVGLSSTWDVDEGGDLILAGSFRKSIAELKAGRRSIPLLNQHDYSSVRSVFGKAVDAEETAEGLASTFRVVASQDGEELLARLRDEMVEGLSIGYYVPVGGAREPNDEEQKLGARRVLTDIDWKETSVVIWGMNPYALIDSASVKSMAASLGKVRRGALTAADLQEVRRIASYCGALLRKGDDPPPVEDDPTADVDDPPEPDPQPAPDAPPPDAPPGDPAAAPKGYANADALRQRLLAVRLASTINAVRQTTQRVTA